MYIHVCMKVYVDLLHATIQDAKYESSLPLASGRRGGGGGGGSVEEPSKHGMQNVVYIQKYAHHLNNQLYFG